MKIIIEKNREKVSKNKGLYEKSEQSVRAHLIEPVLNELGWITSDPDFVIPNSRTSENDIPDYTLMYKGKEITYVEAKKITQNIRPNISQLARYCTNQGIEYGILTDGMKWILFKAFEVGKKAEERIIWEVDFEKDSNEEIEMRLTTIKCDNFQNLKVLSDKNDKLISAWDEIIINPIKLKNAFTDIIKSDLENSGYTFELHEIENFVISKLQSQTKLFLKENIEIFKPDKTSIEKKIIPTLNKEKVTAGMFEHKSNGIFNLKSNKSIIIDATKSLNEVKEQLKENGLFNPNIGSFRDSLLRNKAGLLGNKKQ